MYYGNFVIDNKSRYTDELYTYASKKPLKVGQVANLTFGKSKKLKRGFVFETDVEPDFDIGKIKEIDSVDDTISLNEEMISTVSWMRQRYGIKYIDGINCFIPPGKVARNGKEKIPEKNIGDEEAEIQVLTSEQHKCLLKIKDSIVNEKNESFLLHGVTGSGKTEVYLQAVSEALNQGKTSIVLVPEIALTRQVVQRFAHRFGEDKIALLHSKLTVRQRYDEWSRVRSGKAKIIIGARIGVFAPAENLGLIILDEEHEATYKSDQTPKYDTVDIAAKRLMYSKGTMILGSATPSVVSYQRAREGIYTLLEMNKRYNSIELPHVKIIDMRNELKQGNRTMFSRDLSESINATLSAGEQVILFLNRRGFSTSITCVSCGETIKCHECGITMVYHKGENAAVCHYCGRKQPVPRRCPGCKSDEIKFFGIGTEQVEEEVSKIFPSETAARFDLDTAKNTGEIDRMIKNFAKGKIRILIGTQLVAKGLDFKNVGLVGVISADSSLNIPDYRATERTFQLITQVAGRAGRGEKQGKVIIQTYSPDNFAINSAANHDYRSFFRQEIIIRNFMKYPPYTDLIAVEFTSQNEEIAENAARNCRNYLIKAGLERAENIFEPRLSENFKGKDNFRYNILIKCPKGARNKYIHYLRFYEAQNRKMKKQKWVQTIDVNPYSTF